MSNEPTQEELVNVWRESWINSLVELSDYNLQKEKWLDPENSNPDLSFVGFICGYFDDLFTSDGYYESLRDGYLSEDEYNCIEEFHHKLDSYQPPSEDNNNEEILNDTKWLEVTELGKNSVLMLKELLLKKEEIKLIKFL